MATIPRLTMRAQRQVELVLPTKPGVLSFSVGAANTLDTAFSGATEMFRVYNGGTYRSPSIRERGLGRTYHSNRGLSRVLFDFEDFWTAGSALPHDPHMAYVRIAEVNGAGTVLPEGPIFVVPPPGFFSSPRPSMSLVGTAPSTTPLATGLVPAGAMHIALPKFSDNFRIKNLSTTDNLYVSFGPGQPAVTVTANATGSAVETFFDAATADLYLFGDGATVAFEVALALVNGEMA